MPTGPYLKASKPKPVSLNLRLAFGSLSAFVTGYAAHVGNRGLFVRSRDPRPVGTRLSFELKLGSGEVVLAGKGLVRWVQGLDARGGGTPGMGLEFEHLTDESRRVVELMAAERARTGLKLVDGADPEQWRPLSEFPPVVEAPPEEEEPPPPPMMTPAPGFVRPEFPEPTDPLPHAQLHRAQVAPPVVMFPTATVPVTPEVDEVTAPLPQASARRGLVADSSPSSPPPPMPRAQTATLHRVTTPASPRVRQPLGLQLEGSELRLASNGRTWAIPATVALSETGELVFGDTAQEAIAAGMRGTRGLGSLLGLRPGTKAARSWERRHFLKVVVGDDLGTAIELGGRRLSATTLSEGVIAEGLRQAYDGANAEPGLVVVALPAGQAQAKKRALEEAVLACGLDVCSMTPASALNALSEFGDTGRRRMLVVDLGEEQLEIAIVEQNDRSLGVVATHSTVEHGAVDVDLLLVEALLTQFEKSVDVTVPEDLGIFERVREAASVARAALSNELEHEVFLPNLVETGLSRADLRQKITRARLQALSAPLVDRILQTIRSVLAERGLGPKEIDQVLLVGHGTRLPALGLRLKELFGNDSVQPSLDSFEAVRGATRVAESATTRSAFTVEKTVGTPLWVLPADGVPKRLLERGLSLPAERTYVAVADEGALEQEIALLEGESGSVDEDLVGTLLVGPIPAPPHGERARAIITVALDAAGDISLTAKSMQGDEVPTTLDRSRLPTPRP